MPAFGRRSRSRFPGHGNVSAYDQGLNFDTVIADLNASQAAGFAAGQLTENLAARNYMPRPPTRPDTSGGATTVSDRTSLQAAITAGGQVITIDTDITGVVNCAGTDVKIVHDPGIRVETYAPGNTGDFQRIMFVGGEINSMNAVFTANEVSDLIYDGCAFNSGVFGSGSPWQHVGVKRVLAMNCVGRAGPPSQTTGAFSILNECEDFLIIGCNWSGSEGGGVLANDWVLRHSGARRCMVVDSWFQSIGAGVQRYGAGTIHGPAFCSTWTKPANRGTTRESRMTNLGHPLMPYDTNLVGLDSNEIRHMFERQYADDLVLPNVAFGGLTTAGPPYSRVWVFHESVMEADAVVCTPTIVTNRQNAADAGEEEFYYDLAIVETTPTRSTPPTLSSAELLAAGYTGGEPQSNVGSVSDPYDLPDV